MGTWWEMRLEGAVSVVLVSGVGPVDCGEPLEVLKSEEWHRFTFYENVLAAVRKLDWKGEN